MLFARLSPLRVERLRTQLDRENPRLNLDLVPISYYNNSVLWSTQFKGGETAILKFFSKLPSFWLLDMPLLLALGILFFLWLKQKPLSRFLVPLSIMGLTTIIIEVCVLVAFQTFYGYVYGKIALLLTLFMAGLFLGAWRSLQRKTFAFRQLLVIQFGMILLLLGFEYILVLPPPEILMFVLLLALGFWGGDLFVVANGLLLEEKKAYGLGYGLDLLGSFAGALAAAAFLIPLVGLVQVLKYLSLLNSFCFLFLVARWRH
jgi:spermidine synthase